MTLCFRNMDERKQRITYDRNILRPFRGSDSDLRFFAKSIFFDFTANPYAIHYTKGALLVELSAIFKYSYRRYENVK